MRCGGQIKLSLIKGRDHLHQAPLMDFVAAKDLASDSVSLKSHRGIVGQQCSTIWACLVWDIVLWVG